MKAISILLLALALSTVLPTAGLAQPAQPACAPASAPTPNTACGACGTGYRVGRIGLQTDQQPRLRVGVDGYWETCIVEPDITPGTACGAPGVGVALGGNYRVARHEPGWRVDDKGRWTECDRPCVPPGATASDYRTWSVGQHQCTTRVRPGVGRRDETIPHGQATTWRQWTGPMRGELIERCDDSVRSVARATCAPAQQCDTHWAHEGYAYDGRVAPVALGEYAQALATDGTTRRLRCVAGSWVEAPQCAAGQTVVRHYNSEVRRYRYDGAGVEIGAKVRAEQIEVRHRDGRVVTEPAAWRNSIRWTMATCGSEGRLR